MDTRTAILEHAERAARQKGHNGFSFGHIARDVGIRKASMFHHFPTKPDLLVAVFTRYSQRFYAWFDGMDKSESNGAASIAAYLAETRATIEDGESICLSIALCVDREALEKQLIDDVKEFQTRNLTWLTQAFARGRNDGSVSGVSDPESEAMACLAQVDGAIVMSRLHKDTSYFDRALAQLRLRLS